MISSLYFRFILVLVFTTLIDGYPRYRRQLNQQQRTSWASHPSGSIPGSYYYGIGSDPNYGSFIKPQNRPDVGLLPISYNPDSSLSSYLINQNQPQIPQQSQQQYLYNTNNNAWSRPNMNTNYNKPHSNYPPGSQGWYATGGNYWYNKGQFIILQPYVLILSILILIACK